MLGLEGSVKGVEPREFDLLMQDSDVHSEPHTQMFRQSSASVFRILVGLLGHSSNDACSSLL